MKNCSAGLRVSCAGRKKTLFEGLDSYNRRITLPRRPARTERDQEESHNGKDNGKNCSTCEIQRLCISGSEIYGGLANTWDYGNLGVELKNNVKRAWWKKFVQENPYNVGVDCAILMNSQTWVASGHIGGFSDPLMDCKACKERFRADKLIETTWQRKALSRRLAIGRWSRSR